MASEGLNSDTPAAIGKSLELDDVADRALGVAQFVAKMEPCEPDILRATRARNVLISGGRRLRRPRQSPGLYDYSVPVSKIQEFWSHSWHGRKYLKALLLLLLYNGPAATILGTLSALLMMFLHSIELLPGLESRTQSAFHTEEVVLVYTPWCTLAGGLVFIMILFTWRSQRWVFFDQICINQYESRLKMLGILSIGSFLKYSETFLLVWDETYAQRLWCMLELAAFFRSHDEPEAKIRIRPTAMAPCVLVTALSLWASLLLFILALFQGLLDICIPVAIMGRWAAFAMVPASLRAHDRTTETMLEQLSDYTVEGASCECCRKGHEISLDGKAVDVCDRDVVNECIRTWYGSVNTFEGIVRLRIRNMLYDQLGASLFPYGWQLVGASPMLWGWLDLISSRTRAGLWREATIVLINTLGWWLFLFPFLFQTTFIIARYCRKRAKRLWLDQLKTILISLVPTMISLVANWASLMITDVPQACLCFVSYLLLAAASYLVSWHQARKMKLIGAEPNDSLTVGVLPSKAPPTTSVAL